MGRVLADLRAEGADLAVTGFPEGDIDRLLAELNAANLADVVEPPLPEVPKVAKSKRGEVYPLGAHRLMCGDSTNADDVLKLMDGGRAALCATDPPYLVDYDGTNHPQSFEREQAGKDNNKHWDSYIDPKASVEFFSAFLRVALAHALVENPAIYQWHASRRQALVEAAWKANGLLLHQQLIWAKSRPILTRSHFMWQHEPCFYGWVEGKPPAMKPPASGDCTTVWTINGEQEGTTRHRSRSRCSRARSGTTRAPARWFTSRSAVQAARSSPPRRLAATATGWSLRRNSWTWRASAGPTSLGSRASSRARARWRRTVSRPKLDEVTTQKICDLLRAGNYLDTAATAAGVHKTTLHRWLRLGREQKRGRYKKFVEAVEKAQGEAEARDVALIAKQAPTDWRAAAWRLERRAPRRYGQRVQISIEEELEAAMDRLKAGLDPETYDKVLQLLSSDDPIGLPDATAA